MFCKREVHGRVMQTGEKKEERLLPGRGRRVRGEEGEVVHQTQAVLNV